MYSSFKKKCLATFQLLVLLYNTFPFSLISVSSEGFDNGGPECGVHHGLHAHHDYELAKTEESQEAVVAPFSGVYIIIAHLEAVPCVEVMQECMYLSLIS